ncbi:MAG TPA: hypothetical protein VJ603_05615 [Paucimonas sp.]|nr:hypothetical protein [Paucimonas sp.]HJW56421.1 hypothetical protein [Burkholderiaceae bacterium]
MNTKSTLLMTLVLTACGGGGTPDPAVNMPDAQSPVAGIPSGAHPGWKISWGTGQKSVRVIDPVTLKLVSETTWNVSSVFQELLAETSPVPLIIDEGPNKGQTTGLRWKGTTIPYDNLYHPLTAAVCKTTDGGWAGYGSTGTYAVYEDDNGEGGIYADHLASRVGANVVSMHAVATVPAPAACGSSPVWYTSYYDRGSNGPGTLSY